MLDVLKNLIVCFCLVLPVYSSAQLNAAFESDTNRGCTALGVQFTDLSTGNITSRTWDFGNGNTSSLINPFENFSIGVFTVSLTVSDGVNTDTETKTAFIQVFSDPTASFSFNPNTGCTPLPVNFTSTSTPGGGPIVTYIWDVKDGSSSPNAASITHTYQGGGPYFPSLQVIDVNGCSDNFTTTSSITPTASPVADFGSQASPIGCAVPFTVDFVNSSTGASLNYRWDFGDGTTSTQANPSHTYNSLGNYTVRLIVNDPNCSDTIIKQDFVRLNNTNADFTFPKDSVCFGEEVSFTNASVGANNFSWDFDDGSSRSFTRNPKHTFLDTGWFDVTLVASAGSACIDQVIKQVYVELVIADFEMDTLFNCDLPDTVRFIDKSFRAHTYDWRMGKYDDMSRQEFSVLYSDQNPLHVQELYRRYYDTLIITSKLGCRDTMIKNDRYAEEVITRINLTGPLGTDGNYASCLPFDITARENTSGPGPYVSYEWTLPDGSSYSGRTPPDFSFDTVGGGSYTLTVTNSLGCTAVDIANVDADTIHDPIFSVTPDSVCMFDTITVQMLKSVGNVYEFSMFTAKYANGYTEDAVNFGLFSAFRDTGYHTVAVKAGTFCDTILRVDSAFYVIGPVFNPMVSGDCLDPLTVNFDGNILAATRFYWDFGDGSPLDSINENPTHTYPKDTIYKVYLTAFNDTNRCPMIMDSINVDLRNPIPPTNLPYKKLNCRSQDSIRLYFNNSLLYDSSLWYVNGNYWGNFEDSTFSIDEFIDGESNVRLIGINSLGCRDTINEFLFVSNLVPNFSSNVQGGCIPFNVQMIDLSVSDTIITDYEWYFSNKPNDTFRVPDPIVNINTANDIEIRLVIRDSAGCVADTIIDDLIKGGELDVDFSTIDDPDICLGESIQFINRSTGDSIYSIWNFGDGVIDTINTTLVDHQFNVVGNYTIQLVVVDRNACRDTLNRFTINVEDKPTADFTADQRIGNCYPFAVNFSDNSSGSIAKWEWDLGTGDSIVVQNPFRNYVQPGNFDVRLIVTTANECSDTIVKPNYIQISGPTADIITDKEVICLNEPIIFTMTNAVGAGTFRWAFGDGNSSTTNPTTHIYTDTAGLIQPTLILTDPLGNCEVFLRDSITIREVIAKFSLDDSSGCAPFSPAITNLMQGEETFSWEFGDGNTSNERQPNLTYAQAGIYNLKLSVSSNIGCTDDAVIPVVVLEKPIASINGDLSICENSSTNLTAAGGDTYEWYQGSNLLGSQANITLNPDTITDYRLIVKNLSDCSDTIDFTVYVQEEISYVPIKDTTIIIGDEIQLNAFAGVGFSYSWTPELGLSCSDCANPTAQPLSNTEYILTIKDSVGCFSLTDTIFIEVKEAFTLDVPQAFSPNGDGKNDIIYAEGLGLKELIAFKIYNRFGELVFESNDFNRGWDGTYNGKAQMIETYVYTVEAETFKGEILQKKGNITLLR